MCAGPSRGNLMPSSLPVTTEFAIGAFTGLVDCTLFHWIDTLKVRAQDRRPLLMDLKTGGPLKLSILGAPRFAAAAVGSLYAGFSTNLSLKLPYMASMFAFNALNTQLLDSVLPGDGSGSGKVAKELAAAALVGIEVSLLLSPLEMVRIQGQNCGKGGLFSAARAVNHTACGAGALALWTAWTRGMTATMNRESKYCAGQFFLCEKIAEAVATGRHDHSATSTSTSTSGSHSRAETCDARAKSSILPQVVGAVLGGIACTAISHPDDVIKTRMQTYLRGSDGFAEYPNFLTSGRRILQREGLAALYQGAAFRCLLRVPLGLSVIIVSGNAIRERIEAAA